MGNFIYFILIGGVAGWLAGQISKGAGFGILKNILIGIAGGVIGAYCFSFLGLNADNTLIGQLVTSTVGAVLLLWVLGKIKK